MEFNNKCLLTGAAPYDNVKYITAMMAKLYSDIPSLMFLPNISENEDINTRTFSGMPGVKLEDGKISLHLGTTAFQTALAAIDKAYTHPSAKHLEPYGFESVYLEKFLQMIHKFKSPHAIVNFLGPFTISQIITGLADEQLLTDKNFRKLFIHTICVKALWIIDKIKNECPETVPLIMFEEPALSRLGTLKRENESITSETIVMLLSKVFSKVKNTGAMVGVQCFEKCDWSIPIRAGVDMISFDAYNNPNNLSIIPELINDYLQDGGLINWAIVPAESEKIIKNTTAEDLWKRTTVTFAGLISAGVSPKLLYKSSIVSVSKGAEKLPVFFAEKAFILNTKIAQKLAVLS